jgi:hypothetical protein
MGKYDIFVKVSSDKSRGFDFIFLYERIKHHYPKNEKWIDVQLVFMIDNQELLFIVKFLKEDLKTVMVEKTDSPQIKCEKLLLEPEIRFAGIIDPMGNLKAGGFKGSMSPLMDEMERKKMFMEVALRVATRRDFDKSLGEVEFSISKRKKSLVLSFPIGKMILLVSTNPNQNINYITRKIKNIFGF